MKKILSFILALIFCISIASCTGADKAPITDDNASDGAQDKAPEIVDEVYSLSEDIENFKTHGRTAVSDMGLICDTSASGIEFNAYIEGDLKIALGVNKDCYFTLYIDGVRSEERIYAAAGESTVTLASFESGAVHNVKFIKQTEAQQALCVIKTVGFLGYFETPPADAKYLIEVIGDSITVGFGNLCTNGTANSQKAIYQDATQTYGYLTGESLGADVSLVCYSGIGISLGYPSFTMDSYFAADSYVRDKDTKFVPDRIPDVVVINLGTNDQTKGASNKDLAEKVPALISQIREIYGKKVPIVWLHGMMGEGKWTYIDMALKRSVGSEKSGIYSLEVDQNSSGGGGHPDLKAHKDTSEILAKFLKDKGIIK